MPCYNPLYAYRTTSLTKNGKPALRFIPKGQLKLIHGVDGELRLELPSDIKDKLNDNLVTIPCGNCIGCRLEYSRQWAIRMQCEAKLYKNNYFVTLTYDDDHLPLRVSPAGDTVATLNKRDLQLFLKRLRKKYSTEFKHVGIRYFACGEYGESFGRPHYHICFFNLPIFDLIELKEKSKSGKPQFKSSIISDLWSCGLVRISEFNFTTAAYCSRYVTKKVKGQSRDFYFAAGLDPEFSVSSRRPGIGGQYYIDHISEILEGDHVYVSSSGFPLSVRPPHYFDTLSDKYAPDRLANLKVKRREVAEGYSDYNSDVSEGVYNSVKESNKCLKVSALRRDL